MLEGALIGAVVGVVMVIIQNNRKKKKEQETLDGNLTDTKSEDKKD